MQIASRWLFRRIGIALIAIGVAAFAAVAASAPRPAWAFTPAAVVGFDWSHGPSARDTRGALAVVAAALGRNDLALAGVRYDDDWTGLGTSITGGGGLAIAGPLFVRGYATRFVGDTGLRAWRWRLGSQVRLGAASLAAYYSHYEDNAGAVADGALAEGELPFSARLRGRVSAGHGLSPDAPHGSQGSLGLAWLAVAKLELRGELGLTQGSSFADSPAGGGIGPPAGRDPVGSLLGGGPSGSNSSNAKSTTTTASPLVQLGVRYSFP